MKLFEWVPEKNRNYRIPRFHQFLILLSEILGTFGASIRNGQTRFEDRQRAGSSHQKRTYRGPTSWVLHPLETEVRRMVQLRAPQRKLSLLHSLSSGSAHTTDDLKRVESQTTHWTIRTAKAPVRRVILKQSPGTLVSGMLTLTLCIPNDGWRRQRRNSPHKKRRKVLVYICSHEHR